MRTHSAARCRVKGLYESRGDLVMLRASAPGSSKAKRGWSTTTPSVSQDACASIRDAHAECGALCSPPHRCRWACSQAARTRSSRPPDPWGSPTASFCSTRSRSCWPSSFQPCSPRWRSRGGFAPPTRAPAICRLGPIPDASSSSSGRSRRWWSSSWAASPGSARTELDPAQPLPSHAKPLEVDVVSLDWKWLFIYPRQGVASVNRLVAPVGVPLHLRITSATVLNVFFVPRARQRDLRHERHGRASSTCRPTSRAFLRARGAFQRRWLLGHGFRAAGGRSDAVRRLGRRNARSRHRCWMRRAYRALAAADPERQTLHLPRGAGRPVRCHPDAAAAAGRRPAERARRTPRPLPTAGEIDVFGKLTWQAIPFDQPIPLAAGAVVVVSAARGADRGSSPRAIPLPVARMDHERRSQAHRHHVLPAGAGHAAARLHRCADDALATGAGVSMLPAICRRSITIRSSRRTAPS